MGCKFKYNGQTYESEADLKAVLRQELKANTAKVRDGDVDMAGLDAAQEVNIPTGGTAAAKWQLNQLQTLLHMMFITASCR
jgi:hypothetical protein